MALPQPAIAIPREVRSGTLSISPKPSATIHFTSVQANHTDGTPQLVVFLNGLMTNKTSWLAAIAGLIQSRRSIGFPNMLAYDRYGQGLTEDHDPQDIGREEGHGHDVADTTNDLHHIILHVAEHGFSSPLRNYQLIFVANSIGCAIARLYAQFHPRTVAGLLLLDSMMANSNFDFWPNPDSENFREEDLQDDCSVEVLREQRAKYLAIFSPQATNKEGLSRRNLALLLPKSNEPRLIGSDGKGPWITVVGHDPETFAQESLKSMGTPLSLSMRYSNPCWHEYNQGLVKITNEDRSRGPIIAKGCGHFIQRDDPGFVVEELSALLDRLRTGGVAGE